MSRKILCLPDSALDWTKSSSGQFLRLDKSGITTTEKPKNLFLVAELSSWIEKTDDLERDESWLQVIPYVIIRYAGEFLCYRRSPREGESRLHGLVSAGIGGHVEFSDGDSVSHDTGSSIYNMEAIFRCASREVEEETGKKFEFNDRDWAFCGVIFDRSNPVGRVHLGLVFVLNVMDKFDPSGELDFIGWKGFQDIMEMSVKNLTEPWTSIISSRLPEFMVESLRMYIRP